LQKRGGRFAVDGDVVLGWRAHAFEGIEQVELATVSEHSRSASAAAIMLPPRQTPHSTKLPGMRAAAT
jgi:hypothetical protein